MPHPLIGADLALPWNSHLYHSREILSVDQYPVAMELETRWVSSAIRYPHRYRFSVFPRPVHVDLPVPRIHIIINICEFVFM